EPRRPLCGDGTLMEAEMEATSSAIGHMVIVVLYIAIGAMSAAGSAFIVRSILSAKWEQIFFGLFLIPIAGFYLAFAAYFGAKDAWQLEATAVAFFRFFAFGGTRFFFFLIMVFFLHEIGGAAQFFPFPPPHHPPPPLLVFLFFPAPYIFIRGDFFSPRRND